MKQTGTKQEYYEAWAKMMITIWLDKMMALNIRDTGALLNSLAYSVIAQSGGDVEKIVHTYLYYGRMVDMGVHRGKKQGDIGLKKKPWYNKAYYHSIKVLTEKASELYGEEFQAMIVEALNF